MLSTIVRNQTTPAVWAAHLSEAHVYCMTVTIVGLQACLLSRPFLQDPRLIMNKEDHEFFPSGLKQA